MILHPFTIRNECASSPSAFFTFQHNIDFPTRHHSWEGDFPSCFCAVMMIGSSVCCSEQSVGQSLVSAWTLLTVWLLFTNYSQIKLNELAVMHFDLQFNNYIWVWDSKPMSLWCDNAIHFFGYKSWTIFWLDMISDTSMENRLNVIPENTSYSIPIFMCPIIEKH